MFWRSAYLMLILGGIASSGASYADTVKVFVLAGQSNAVGFGSDANELPPELYAPQSDVLLWFEEGPYNSVDNPELRISSGEAFVELQFQHDPTGATFGGLVDGFGPEIKLGRGLADALNDDVAVVKFAINATSLAQDWNPDDPESLYAELTGIVANALAELADMGLTPQVSGFFWMQGEWDCFTEQDALAYDENLTHLIDVVREEYSDAGLPFVFGRLNVHIDESCCYSFPYLDEVRAGQATVAETVASHG